MAERTEIQQAFDAFGKRAGMVKHSGSWYKTGSEVIPVVNLQKSQYGSKYFINVGFWLQRVEEAEFPPSELCHIVMRIEDVAPDREEEVKLLLDLGSGIPAGERGQRLLELMESRLKPVLELGSSLHGLKQLRSQGLMKGAGIRGPAIPILDAA